MVGQKYIFIKGAIRGSANTFAYIKLFRKIKSFSPNLLYTNTVFSPLGGMLALGLGIPHIWHIRELVHEQRAKYDIGEKLSMKFINKASQKIICNSIAVYETFKKDIPSEKLCVVYNGVLESTNRALDCFQKKLDSKSTIKLCIVGALCENKNQSEAILALSLLVDSGIDANLILKGNGEKSYLSKLKQLTQKLGITSRVLLDSYSEDAIGVFRASDISLVCSKSETFGRVAVESMSVGTPVVAANVGGLSEIIEDGVNGLLYQSGDYKMLATKIIKLIQEPNLYESISKNALASVYKRFTREQYVANIKAVMEEVITKQIN
jgi:glycosyltransferase involved in cell wall biosynthesis